MNSTCLRVFFVVAPLVIALAGAPAAAYYVDYDYYCYATNSDGIPVRDDETLFDATFVEGDYIKNGDYTNYGKCSFQADMSRGTVWARAHSHGVQTGPYSFPSGTGRVDNIAFQDRLFFTVPAGTYPEGVQVGLSGHVSGFLWSEIGAGAKIRCEVSLSYIDFETGQLEVGTDEDGSILVDEDLLLNLQIVMPGTTLNQATEYPANVTAGIYGAHTWSTAVNPGGGSVIGDADYNFGSGIRITEVLVPPGVTWSSDSGVFLGDLSDVPEATAAAKVLQLKQNHPNPFNPSTTIGFDLAQAGRVTLSIFDPTGHLVRTLLNEAPRAAGLSQVVWDGRDLAGRQVATGVYHYRLTSGELSQTRSMVLLK